MNIKILNLISFGLLKKYIIYKLKKLIDKNINYIKEQNNLLCFYGNEYKETLTYKNLTFIINFTNLEIDVYKNMYFRL